MNTTELITCTELLRRVASWDDAQEARRFIADLAAGFRAAGNGSTAWGAGMGAWYWSEETAS